MLAMRAGEDSHLQPDTLDEKGLGDDEDVHTQETMQDDEEEGNDDGGVKGLIHKIWLGDEKAGWQKRRLEREREELENGKGYGDLIMEQVREVFPGFGGGRGRGEEGDEEG